MKCPKCGREIADDSIFCEYCGVKINLIPPEGELLKPDSVPVEDKRIMNQKLIWGVCAVAIMVAMIGGICFYSTSQSDESTQLSQCPPEQPLNELMQRVSSFATISDGLVELTDSNFDAFYSLSYEVPIIIDFYADWYAPCIKMKQIYMELVPIYEDKIAIGIYDIGMYSEKSESYNVQTIPNTYIIYKGEVKKHLLGEYSKEDLIKTINLVLMLL